MLRMVAVALACALLLVNGCARGRSEVLSVIVCAGDTKGLADLKALLRGLAAQEGFEFHDGSENARRDLEALERSNPEVAGRRSSREPIITVEMIHDDGRTVSVTNAFLPGLDVYLSIRASVPDANVQQFAQQLVATMGSEWPVHDLAADRLGPASGFCNPP